MEVILTFLAGTVVLFFIIRHIAKRSYIMGVVDTMVSYKGIVNVKVQANEAGERYYFDLANDIFLFQTRDQQEAIDRASKLFPEARMVVFSNAEIIK